MTLSRAALDGPIAAAAGALVRGWRFRMVSAAGSDFSHAMGFEDKPGEYMPGFSAFRRMPDGKRSTSS